MAIQMRLQLFVHHRVCVDCRVAAVENQFVFFGLVAPKHADRHLLVGSVADQEVCVRIRLDDDEIVQIRFWKMGIKWELVRFK